MDDNRAEPQGLGQGEIDDKHQNSRETEASLTNPPDEVRGGRLLLINASLCLCTLLVGLVRDLSRCFLPTYASNVLASLLTMLRISP